MSRLLLHRSPRALATPALALGWLTLVSVACADLPPTGLVAFGISADQCAAYCLTALRVSLYDAADASLPLGPPLQVDCANAGDLAFTDLPGGLRVYIDVAGYDLAGDEVLTGRSETTTVVAGARLEVEVALTASDPPVIVAVSPEPVDPRTSPTLVVRGDNLAPLGGYGLTLDGEALDAVFAPSIDDSPDLVTATLAADAHGQALVARHCGVASEPFPVRVVASEPGAAGVSALPICTGGAAVGLTTVDQRALVAWRCDDPGSAQLVIFGRGDVCPLDPSTNLPLAANPTGPIVTDGDTAWVARASGPLRLDLGGGGSTSYPDLASVEVLGLARAAATYALASGPDTLVRLDDDGRATPRADPFPELTHLAIGGDQAARLWLASRTASGQGRLVMVPESGTATSWPIDCADPGAVAVAPDGKTVAVSCEGAALFWDVASSSATRLRSDTPSALAFGTASDLAFAASDTLALIDLTPASGALAEPIATQPVTATRLAALPDERLVALTTSGVVVLTPFSPSGPCGASR